MCLIPKSFQSCVKEQPFKLKEILTLLHLKRNDKEIQTTKLCKHGLKINNITVRNTFACQSNWKKKSGTLAFGNKSIEM